MGAVWFSINDREESNERICEKKGMNPTEMLGSFRNCWKLFPCLHNILRDPDRNPETHAQNQLENYLLKLFVNNK